MDITEEKLRKKIWEILVNSPEISDIIQKQNGEDLQKKVYGDIVDLKGYMEKKKSEKMLETINNMMPELNKLRELLQKNVVV
jgi:Tfp pilus assembly ATPase PilU